jgi:hypothetical protein
VRALRGLAGADVGRQSFGKEGEREVVTVCYSYRDRKREEEVRRTANEQELRRRREERAKAESKERAADKDRELVRA